MTQGAGRLFDADVWTPALEKYSGVTSLTVALFDATGQIVIGPIHSTPLFELFAQGQYDTGLVADCLQRCLHTETQGAVVSANPSGLAVVGTPLALNGDLVGAAVEIGRAHV